jgi:hypothetical protein
MKGSLAGVPAYPRRIHLLDAGSERSSNVSLSLESTQELCFRYFQSSRNLRIWIAVCGSSLDGCCMNRESPISGLVICSREHHKITSLLNETSPQTLYSLCSRVGRRQEQLVDH